MLIEIHALQNHAPSNLNRDDTGSPKECVFGGVKRARISSQCLKRSIRCSLPEISGLEIGIRTKRLKERLAERLGDMGRHDDEKSLVLNEFIETYYSSMDSKRPDETSVLMFISEAEVSEASRCIVEEWDTLLRAANARKDTKKADGEEKKGKKKKRKVDQEIVKRLKNAGLSVDIALFGRMVAEQRQMNVQASVQVAHAVSTHRVDHEYDYFTAVDELKGDSGGEDEDAGAGMIGDVEFNSACYYKYFSIDLKGLVNNLTGESLGLKEVSEEDRRAASEVAKRAVEAFLKAAILTTPTGKQNTFAAHQCPAAVLVEVRPARTPISYANAFVEPVRLGGGKDLVKVSLDNLASHVKALTEGFNLETRSRLLLAPAHEGFTIDGTERVKDLNTLCERLRKVMADG